MTTSAAAAIRVLIVDDEAPARQRLRELLGGRRDVTIAAEADDVDGAVAAIRSRSIDLLFLDIQMPGCDGFRVVERVGPQAMPSVIFVTAFDAHALRAFEVHALDYLLKPFDDRRFERALDHAVESIRRQRLEGLCGRLQDLLASIAPGQESPVGDRPRQAAIDSAARLPKGSGRRSVTEPERLAVRSEGRLRLIAIADIDWIEAAGTYVRLHTGDRSLLLRQPLGRLEHRLRRHRFVRIHRSTLVRTDRIQEVRAASHGDATVVLEDGTELRLSRSHRSRLDALIGSC